MNKASRKLNKMNNFEYYSEIITRSPPPLIPSTSSSSSSSSPSSAASSLTSHIADKSTTDTINAFDNDEYNLFVFNRTSDEKHVALHETTRSDQDVLEQPAQQQQSPQSRLISEPAEKEMQPQVATSLQVTASSSNQSSNENNNDSEFYYYYTSWEKCYEVLSRRCISTEKMFTNDRQLVEGIVLLTLPPSASDNELLLEYFGPSVPVDKRQVECYIRLRRETIDQNKQHLVRMSPNKFLCKRKILFATSGNSCRLPKHEFRASYFAK